MKVSQHQKMAAISGDVTPLCMTITIILLHCAVAVAADSTRMPKFIAQYLKKKNSCVFAAGRFIQEDKRTGIAADRTGPIIYTYGPFYRQHLGEIASTARSVLCIFDGTYGEGSINEQHGCMAAILNLETGTFSDYNETTVDPRPEPSECDERTVVKLLHRRVHAPPNMSPYMFAGINLWSNYQGLPVESLFQGSEVVVLRDLFGIAKKLKPAPARNVAANELDPQPSRNIASPQQRQPETGGPSAPVVPSIPPPKVEGGDNEHPQADTTWESNIDKEMKSAIRAAQGIGLSNKDR